MNKLYNSKSFQFFAMSIIASLCLLFDQLTRISFNHIDLPKNHPEYNAESVEGKIFNKSGSLLYDLFSDKAWQYPDDNRVFLRQLKFYVYDESSGTLKYELDSSDGWINHINKLGWLGNNSVVTIENSDPKQVVRIYGSNIKLDLDNMIFSSNENTHAVEDKSQLYTKGFTYYSNKKFLDLVSNVKVIYEK